MSGLTIGKLAPYTKPTGTVLYRLSDVLAAEAAPDPYGRKGFTWAAMDKSLKSYVGLTHGQRFELMRHLKNTLGR